MVAREAPPPSVIGKAGRYTVFITPSRTPRPSEGPRSQTPSPSPSPSPKLGPRNVAPLPSESFRSMSSSSREKMRSSLSPKAGDSSPMKGFEKSAAVAPPPPQFENGKGERSVGGVFGFFWDVVAKVQDAHSSLDQYLVDWLGLDQSRYQWALDDYYENNGSDCVALEDLYLSHNGIAWSEGLSKLANLRVLDVSSNKLTSINDIENLTSLEDLWLNDNQIASLEGINQVRIEVSDYLGAIM